MPLYDYECNDCEHSEEFFMDFYDESPNAANAARPCTRRSHCGPILQADGEILTDTSTEGSAHTSITSLIETSS